MPEPQKFLLGGPRWVETFICHRGVVSNIGHYDAEPSPRHRHMSDDEDDYGIGRPIDEDYVDVESSRADISVSEDEDDNLDRSPLSRQTADIDMSHRFDIGRGSGAAEQIDDKIDENAVIENDGRSRTRTFYYPGEAPARARRRYRRMLRWQEGEGSPDRDVRNKTADRERWVDTFCSNLDMTPYQQRRVKFVCNGLNMKHMAHYSTEKVILAVISLVANEDARFIRDEEGYRDLLRAVGSDLSEVKSIRDLVRRKSDRL